jgi:hypothetical protein
METCAVVALPANMLEFNALLTLSPGSVGWRQ